jgi:hypothetical protein
MGTGRVPIRVENEKWRILPVGEVHDQLRGRHSHRTDVMQLLLAAERKLASHDQHSPI